ncbi:MAG: ROK family protein [Bryobacteraceae bacterium]
MTAPAIAVDMGGSHVTCALLRGQEILSFRSIKAYDEPLKAVLPRVQTEVEQLLASQEIPAAEYLGLAVGFCGITDSENDTVIATNGKFEDACGFDFRGWARHAFGLRLRLENDARLALLGENFAGAARNYSDAVMVTLGTGIGGVAMLNGKLLRSHSGRAGVIGGHLPLVMNGRRCNCGNVGCAEAEASTWALPMVCREWPGFSESSLVTASHLDFQSLFLHADRGDRIAGQVLDRCIQVWSALTVALIHAYDPQVVVFGGGVLKRAADILPRIRKHVEQHAWIPAGSIAIVEAQLSSHAALYGAVPLLTDGGGH